MMYSIFHWYGKKPPVPEAVQQTFTRFDQVGTKKRPQMAQREVEGYAVEVADLHEFATKHGPIQLRPPKPEFPHWTIAVTDETGKWYQK